MLTYTPANSIFDGPLATLLSVLCILMEVLSLAHAKGKKVLNDFKFGIFVDRFPNDDATSMAVKWLNHLCAFVFTNSLSLSLLLLFCPNTI